jgi:two-component system, OmpR family, KDP operon response regulator KdpE
MTTKVRVLVANSETPILRTLKGALAANHYEIASVESAADAMKHIAAESPEIVLLDPALPDGDGRDVIRRIREWSDVPIIVISGARRSAEKVELLDLGADDFIDEPFDLGELMARAVTSGCKIETRGLCSRSVILRSIRNSGA